MSSIKYEFAAHQLIHVLHQAMTHQHRLLATGTLVENPQVRSIPAWQLGWAGRPLHIPKRSEVYASGMSRSRFVWLRNEFHQAVDGMLPMGKIYPALQLHKCGRQAGAKKTRSITFIPNYQELFQTINLHQPSTSTCLVVEPPLWKIWKSVEISSLNIWKNRIVPNHQPAINHHPRSDPRLIGQWPV